MGFFRGGFLPRPRSRATIVLCLPALLGDLSHNNVNIFILFLIVGCLEAFRGRLDGLAGLTLALAVACKVTPLLFVAYFAWKRCWRVLGATLVGLVLWLVVVPGAAFGWNRTSELMSGWYALMIERPLLKGEITTEHPNQAVVGFVYRLFTHSPSYIVYPDNIPTPAEYHNLTDIGRPTAWVIVKLLTAGFAARGSRVVSVSGAGVNRFAPRVAIRRRVRLHLPRHVAVQRAHVEAPRGRAASAARGADVCGRAGRVTAPRAELCPRRLVACFVLTAGPGLLVGRANDLAMVYGTHTIAFALLAFAVGLLLAYRSGEVSGSCGPHEPPIPR